MKVETMQTIYMSWEDVSKALQLYLRQTIKNPGLAQKVKSHGIAVDTNSEGLIIMIDGSDIEMLPIEKMDDDA